ncbi:MAG: caspase family protein [Candidatus Thorarchaeota archaeon]|nr:caspase family protein [Candidatus Thorarchaeota archaeon]
MNRKLVLLSACFLVMFATALLPNVVTAVPTNSVGQKTVTYQVTRTVESYVVESEHPYSNNFDYTWTITKTGASQIRVHFSKIDVENNYDFVYVYDYAGSQLHKLTGLYSDGGWSSWSNGDTIKVRLDTDYSVTKWGFAIDQIEYESGGGGGGGTGDHVLTSGETATGSLSAAGETEMWTIEVEANAESMHSVLTCGSADFDLYGRLGAEPTTSTYDWRGYTSGGEDVTYDNPGAGTWYIMVRDYSGSGSYELTVTITYGGGGGGGGGSGDGVVHRWAVIVGISDYKSISDLSYCDEDATDWYNYLTNVMGYDYVRVLGDTHSSNYPSYYALAKESNVKAALNWLGGADADDQVAFITSGHGSGDGQGSSYLCMWDCSSGEDNEDGNLYDTELAAIVGTWAADKIFIFVDHCYSGGLIPEIQALSNAAHVYMTTTCTDNGYGYDDSTHQNGAWTYYFLEYGLINHYGSSTSTLMEDCFDYAVAAYPHSGGDTPQEFDGNTSVGFTL